MLRKFAIAVLDDEKGINYTAWKWLKDMLLHEGGHADIIRAVKMCNGRVYITEETAANL